MAENETTALTLGREKANGLVTRMQGEWAKVLPKVCTPDRFARMALSCINKNPKLLEAIQTPKGQTTLLAAFMTCAELGIEPDGRRAHLIPFKDNRTNQYDVQLIIDYKGLAELVMRSGDVAKIHADVVCENDIFEYDRGEVKAHKIDFRKPRGEMYACYCIIRMKDGAEKCEAMGKEEVYMVRGKSKAYQNAIKYKSDCPWTDPQAEPSMWAKTVFRKCSKWVPLSPEVKRAIEVSDKEEFIDTTAEVVGETSEGKTATKAKVDKLKAKIANAPPPPSDAPVDAEVVGEGQEGEQAPYESTQALLIRTIAESGAPVTVDNVISYLREKRGMSVTMSLNDLKDKKPVLDEVIRKNPAGIVKDTAEFVGG